MILAVGCAPDTSALSYTLMGGMERVVSCYFVFVKILLMSLFLGKEESKRLYDIFHQATNQLYFNFD